MAASATRTTTEPSLAEQMTDRLDRAEHELPTVPAQVIHLNRAVGRSSAEVAQRLWEATCDALSSVGDAASTAARTVTGQARRGAEDTTSIAERRGSSLADSTGRALQDTADDVSRRARTVAGQARAAVQDTVGDVDRRSGRLTAQARRAADDTADLARDRAREVAGQAEAQTGRVASAVADEAEGLLDDAIDVVEPSPGSGTPYERWTRAELYERAQELDVDGRSTMSKAELVEALRDAS